MNHLIKGSIKKHVAYFNPQQEPQQEFQQVQATVIPEPGALCENDAPAVPLSRPATIISLTLGVLVCVLIWIIPLLYQIVPEIKKAMVSKEDVTVISELAYDVNDKLGCTVYLKESGVMTPYLVLTNNYNESGNTLLLRKDIMDTLRCFNETRSPMISPWPYYSGSDIDNFLEKEYVEIISGVEIIPSTILIPAATAFVTPSWKDTETIERKAFLLSHAEAGAPARYLPPQCGVPLQYFSAPAFEGLERRIAYSGQTKSSWMLRTSKTADIYAASGVAYDGTFGIHLVQHPTGIRPAFCISSDTQVKLKNLEEYGTVFVVTE